AGDERATPPAPLPRNPLLRLIAVVFRAIGTVLRFVVFWLARLFGRVFGLVSMLLSRLLAPLAAATNRMQDAVEARYGRFLPYALAHPGQILGVAALALAFAVALLPGLGLDLVPQLSQGQYEATLKLPP